MSLKLSYRDKVIFISVMIILVLVAGFFLLIRPKFEAVEAAKANLETQQQKKAEIDAKIKTLPDIIQNIKDTAEIVGEKQEMFFDEAHPYINETYIRELMKEFEIEVMSSNTDYTVAGPINWYITQNKNILAYENKMNTDLYNELPKEVYDEYYGNKKMAKNGSSIIGVTSMNITTLAPKTMDELFAVIDRFAADEKTLIVNSIDMDYSSANKSAPTTPSYAANSEEAPQEEPTMTVNLTLYSIYPLNVEKVMEESDEVVVPQE